MKRIITSTLVAGLVAVLGFGAFAVNTYADEEGQNTEESSTPKTSMTIMPVSRTLQISSDSSYDGTFTVTNDGDDELKVEVYSAPYSYVYSDEEDIYKLGFNNENNFTQISRWITVKDTNGKYVSRATYKIPAHEPLNVEYKITTPKSIPAGGQYAVLFAQTVSDSTNSSGIRTEASAGMVIYGHSTEGETITSANISDMTVGRGKEVAEGAEKNGNFYGSAKVENTGNTDFFARGKLKVEPIIGFSSYETPSDRGTSSVIPESERVVEDEWTETPDFGLYKVTWTIAAGGEEKAIEQVFFLISPLAIIITIIVLTIIIVWITIGVRKRKERRSRLAV